jgi:hypothetical protein
MHFGAAPAVTIMLSSVFRSPRGGNGFAAVADNSAHGSSVSSSQHGLFTISNSEDNDDDDDDDDTEGENKNGDDVVEVVLNGQPTAPKARRNKRRVKSDERAAVDATKPLTLCSVVRLTWSALTFSWVRALIAVGNVRPLEQSDLYPLAPADTAKGVYARFRRHWRAQLLASLPVPASADGGDAAPASRPPSYLMALWHAFGGPFMAVGGLKLVHDRYLFLFSDGSLSFLPNHPEPCLSCSVSSCMFVGPMLLNRLIAFLKDPNVPLSTGLAYVAGIFLANFVMSLCLRQVVPHGTTPITRFTHHQASSHTLLRGATQYFFWCYRVGMRLRSAAVTAVFNKSLVLSAAALSRRTTGEISNLMSVDSTRLQDLTPYGHAIWYSLYQIVIAMALLWGQLGPACLAGAHLSPSLGPCHSRDLNHFPRVALLLLYGPLLAHLYAYSLDPVHLFCVCVSQGARPSCCPSP